MWSARARSTSESEAEPLGRALADVLATGGELSGETQERLFAALLRLYARRRELGEASPFVEGAVSVEEVVLAAAEMLKASGVTTFELAALFNV